MRFAVAHKAATYLMVMFAYLAMAGGGGMPIVMVLAGIGALAASWWWEAPRIDLDRWSWVWTVGSLLALAYSVLAAITTGDYLGVGAQFLTWLLIAKAFNRRALRDWQQIYLLAFLMLVAGSVLNADLSYGLCFLGFVISTTWALTLFHLRREIEDNLLVKYATDRQSEGVQVQRILDSKRVVGARFFVGTGGLSFGVFLVAAAIFLALPRVGIGFFLKSKTGLTLSGFSDGVQLGGHGVIKNDPTVVMRVEIAPEYGSRSATSIHWRGVAFDQYLHGQWTRSKRAPDTAQQSDGNQVRDRRFFKWDRRDASPPAEDAMPADYVKQSIWLDPLDSDVLFGAGRPRIVEYPHVLRRIPVAEHNDEIRLSHGSTLHYTVFSELESPPVAQLRAAPNEPLPKNFDVYRQISADITPRTRELALSITAGLTNNYDKAMAIKKWLDDNLTYTLQLADPGQQEPVDFFLFDRQKGHCEYFASAFAVLARENGIPTRNVNGFLGGEWNEYQSYVAVRAGDAHSWDEVYFPTVGWVTFDPTPPADIDELGRGGSGPLARLGRFLDTLKFQWSKWVIEYDLSSQLELFKSIGHAVKSAALTIKDALVAAKNALLELWYLSLLAAAGIAWLLYRRYKRGRPLPLAFLRPRASRPRSTVAEHYLSLTKALAKAGYPRAPGITPRELAARLSAKSTAAGTDLAELVELYYAAEWGAVREPAAEDRAAKLVEKIRAALAEK
ncbi:hypothetical protein BH11MYX2_BH11MYX2_25540 [soil metagenome]